jgi:outer membrane receptor protein involved in Fe transport
MTRVLSGLFAVALLAAGTAIAQQADKRSEFDIAPQALDTALIEFADQAKVQLAVSAERIAGLRTKGLRGRFTHEGALRSLLADTGLTFRAVGERTYSVGDPKAQPLNGNDASGTVSPAMQPPPVAPPAPANVAPTDSGRSTTEARSVSHEEVLVTGTLIREAAPVGAPLTVYDRKEIERSGAATTDAFVRKMPESLGSIDATTSLTAQTGGGGFAQSVGNGFFGAGVNLRGIGPGGTLVLLNGRRMAPSGTTGAFIDVSNIPLAALERVEVLSDGASALYGGDAIAGVANFVLRRDFEGFETSLRYGGTTRGGGKQLTASQLAGISWNSGNALLTLSHHEHDGLLSTERDFIPDPFTFPATLLPERSDDSAFIAARQDLFAGIEVSADALYTERESAATTPNSATIRTFRDASTRFLESGLTLERRVREGWSGALIGTYSTSKQRSLNTVVGAPLAPTRTVGNTRSVASDFRMDGPLFHLPGGLVKAAIGVGYRSEKLEDAVGGAPRNFDREVKSAYAELLVPIVGQNNGVRLIRGLELSIAGRHDDYDDVGSSSNPKFGLAWWPVESVRVRGTYSTSFRATPLTDLTEFPSYSNRNLPDPAAPDRITTTLINASSGNGSIRPEQGKSLTLGLDFTPSSIPDLTIASTYFELDYDDRVSRPPLVGAVTTIWSQTALLAPFLNRNPTPAEIQQAFATGRVFDLALTGPGGVEAIFDQRVANMADSFQSGVDLSARYQLTLGRSDLSLFVRGIRTFELDYQPATTTPVARLIDLVGFPVSTHVQAGAAWSYRGVGSSLTLRHVDSYENQFITPRGSVDSWTTADLQLSYRVADDPDASFLGGFSIAIDVQNVTDEKPPFVLIPDVTSTALFNSGFDSANASPVGRVVAVQITKRW